MDINAVIDKLYVKHKAEREELLYIVNNINEEEKGYLIKKARTLAEQNFSNKVFLRGLIEFTNYCRNDCYYCSIRKSNLNAVRYRLTPKQILDCCRIAYGWNRAIHTT